MTTLLLIRHGETDWNRQGRYQGQSDVPLNPVGLEQAAAAARALDGRPLDAVYTSDLQRARATAQAVAAATGAPLLEDRRLREVHQGDWEGQLFDDIRVRDAERLAARRRDPLGIPPPGGETVLEVRARALAALDEIVRRHPAGRVAIVSHGLTLAVIKTHLAGAPIESVWERIPPNAQAEEWTVEAP